MNAQARLASAFDAAAPAVIAACVLAAAAGSSIQRGILAAGGPLRSVMLGVLLVFALVRAAFSFSVWRFPRRTTFALAAFCGLAVVSVGWSVNPHGTLVRALGVGSVVVACVALTGCVPSRPELADRLLDGVLAGAAFVALAGFVYWVFAPHGAVASATSDYPSRFRGIEENANTAALLLAIGMPLSLARALRARSAGARAVYVVALLGFLASIVASGSRGGLLGGFAGLVAVVALMPAKRAVRIAAALAVVVALAVSAWTMTIPKALHSTSPAAPTPARTMYSVNAEDVLPLQQEIGNPWWTHRSGDSRRSLFNASVRLRAWVGTFHRALARPLLGYGFGAEQWAFVNRYYAYVSQNPENGYLGLLLQLGFVGPPVFLFAVALCVVPGIRACLRRQSSAGYALAAIGAVTAALAAAMSQSYFHGPGSIAFVALWVSLAVAAVAAEAP